MLFTDERSLSCDNVSVLIENKDKSDVLVIYNLYDLYYRTPKLSNIPSKVCEDPDSLLSYLFQLYGHTVGGPIRILLFEQQQDFANELYEQNKLLQKPKNHLHIVFFCMLVHLINKMGGNCQMVTVIRQLEHFFKTLIAAIKSGKISKSVAITFVKRIIADRIFIPQELEELLVPA